jgi:hypothetical protein
MQPAALHTGMKAGPTLVGWEGIETRQSLDGGHRWPLNAGHIRSPSSRRSTKVLDDHPVGLYTLNSFDPWHIT